MKSKKFIPLYILCLLSLAATWMILPMLPEKIATHWGIYGQVDGWSGKNTQLFLAGMPLFMLIMFQVLPMLDPKKQNYVYHEKAYVIFMGAFTLFFIGMNIITVLYNLGYDVDVALYAPFAIGILFAVMGNYMGQFRHNYFIGIRNPWTLANETVWRKTHRIGGRAFMVSGIATSVSCLISPFAAFITLMGSMGLVVIGTSVYSYVIFRQEEKMMK